MPISRTRACDGFSDLLADYPRKLDDDDASIAWVVILIVDVALVACDESSTWPCAIPGKSISASHLSATPVRKRASSTRRTGWPIPKRYMAFPDESKHWPLIIILRLGNAGPCLVGRGGGNQAGRRGGRLGGPSAPIHRTGAEGPTPHDERACGRDVGNSWALATARFPRALAVAQTRQGRP